MADFGHFPVCPGVSSVDLDECEYQDVSLSYVPKLSIQSNTRDSLAVAASGGLPSLMTKEISQPYSGNMFPFCLDNIVSHIFARKGFVLICGLHQVQKDVLR